MGMHVDRNCIVALISGMVNSYFAAHAAQSFGLDLRNAFFEKSSRSPWQLSYDIQHRV